MSDRRAPPRLDGILETALYVDDLGVAADFYRTVLGLEAIFADGRLVALDAGEGRVLLLFRRGGSTRTVTLPGGTIPPHDGAGPLHVAFAVAEADLAVWETHLLRSGIAIEGTTDWPAGGRSLYFRDPDGHLLEIASRDLWRR